MNPNNNNLDYLLKLPTPRLLRVFSKIRGLLNMVPEWDWDNYKLREEELSSLTDNSEVSRWVTDECGQSISNPLYEALEIRKLVNLRERLKKELDTREHVLRTKP